jgi:hypothetical protein
MIEYIKKNWESFPCDTIYMVSDKSNDIFIKDSCCFVLKISNVKHKDCSIIKPVVTDSIFFEMWEYYPYVGFIFKLNVPEGCKLRYHPYLVCVLNRNNTHDDVSIASKDSIVLYENGYFHLIRYDSINTEVLTTMHKKMDTPV